MCLTNQNAEIVACILLRNKTFKSTYMYNSPNNDLLVKFYICPHNHAVKSIILQIFKYLQNDPNTGRIFVQPPFIQTGKATKL